MSNWYRHYPGDYLRDTRFLTLEEHGAYRLLMDHYYTTGKAIPNDLYKIGRVLGTSVRVTRRLWANLEQFFSKDGDMFYHKKIEFELAKSLKLHDTAVANGTAGGKAAALAKAKATIVPSKTKTRVSLSKNDKDTAPNSKDKYQIFNEKLKPLYPKREGSNPWRPAAESMHARLKAGITMEEMIEGTKRYWAFCENKQWVGSSTVMQAKRFYGTDMEFSNDWAISQQHKSIRFPANGDCNAWVNFAAQQQPPIKPLIGEKQFDFERRVKNIINDRGQLK